MRNNVYSDIIWGYDFTSMSFKNFRNFIYNTYEKLWGHHIQLAHHYWSRNVLKKFQKWFFSDFYFWSVGVFWIYGKLDFPFNSLHALPINT